MIFADGYWFEYNKTSDTVNYTSKCYRTEWNSNATELKAKVFENKSDLKANWQADPCKKITVTRYENWSHFFFTISGETDTFEFTAPHYYDTDFNTDVITGFWLKSTSTGKVYKREGGYTIW